MHDKLTDENFLLYCAKHYSNPQFHTTEEFLEDVCRVKYIKKLITRYVQNNDLKEQLILNHIIILCNTFGNDHVPRMLYLKCRDVFVYVKPFLVLLNIMPNTLYNIGNDGSIDCDSIGMDVRIVEKLREIRYA